MSNNYADLYFLYLITLTTLVKYTMNTRKMFLEKNPYVDLHNY